MNKEKVIKIIKGAGVAAAGAVLTYLAEWATGSDLGAWAPAVVAVLSVLANVVRQTLTDSPSPDRLSDR